MAYLLKDTDCDEIIETIRVVHAGQQRIRSVVGVKLFERMSTSELTVREPQVLQLLAIGKSNQEIGTSCTQTRRSVSTTGTTRNHAGLAVSKTQLSSRIPSSP